MGTIFKALEKSQQIIKNEQDSVKSFNIGTLSGFHCIDTPDNESKDMEQLSVSLSGAPSDEENESRSMKNRISFPEEYLKNAF